MFVVENKAVEVTVAMDVGMSDCFKPESTIQPAEDK